MIWNNKNCPLCNIKMEIEYGADYEPIFMLRCPTPLALPQHVERPRFGVKGNFVKSHFEVEYDGSDPVFECLKIYPYMIQSYKDESNIYTLTDRLLWRFVAATPYIDIPWADLDKLIQKLKTYTVFS